MTLHLTPVYKSGEWAGQWDITDATGAPVGVAYVVTGDWPSCVAAAGDIEVTGPTLARAVTALAAVLDHATNYVVVVVDDPTATPPAPEAPRLRVIPEGHQSTIRLDDTASTPIGGAPVPATQ